MDAIRFLLVAALGVLASSIIVGVDAAGLRTGSCDAGGILDTTPITWAVGVLFFWPIVMPLYLINRPRMVEARRR